MRSRSRRLDLGLLAAAGAIGERKSGQIAGQANAAGDDDVGLRAAAAQPFATGMSQVIQIHPWLPSFGAGLETGGLFVGFRVDGGLQLAA